MKVLYVVATGAADPTRASVPLHIAANGSIAAGQTCAIALVGDATELVSPDAAAGIEGVGVPPLQELFTKLVQNQVPVYI